MRKDVATMSDARLAQVAATLVFIYLGPRALNALDAALVDRQRAAGPLPKGPNDE